MVYALDAVVNKGWLRMHAAENDLRVFDPRRNEDFVFGPNTNGVRISSLKEMLLVVLIPPSFTILNSKGNLVRRIILEQLVSKVGFGFVCSYAVPDDIVALLPAPHAASGVTRLSYFMPSRDAFATYNDLLEGLQYGEITIGCCAEKFEGNSNAHGNVLYDDLYVLSHAKQLQRCISFYADTGNAYFVTQIDESTDPFLTKLTSLS